MCTSRTMVMHSCTLYHYMWPGLWISTMWTQITLSYISSNIFSSECGIPFPQISEESPLNSAVVTEILLCLYKQFLSYDRAKTEKNQRFFCAHKVDFCRPGHVYWVLTYVEENMWLSLWKPSMFTWKFWPIFQGLKSHNYVTTQENVTKVGSLIAKWISYILE